MNSQFHVVVQMLKNSCLSDVLVLWARARGLVSENVSNIIASNCDAEGGFVILWPSRPHVEEIHRKFIQFGYISYYCSHPVERDGWESLRVKANRKKYFFPPLCTTFEIYSS